jgi:tetratricopeptide (TPR) repeat protein
VKNILCFALLILTLSALLPATSHAGDPIAKGKAALAAGNYIEAISQFLDATKDNKKDPEGFLLLADAYVKADSLDQAIGALVQARELDTANAQIFNLLGDVYWKQNIHAGAAEQWKHSVEIKHDFAIYMKLGEAWKKLRKYTDATSAYLSALSMDTMNVPALKEVGSLYFRAKLWPNAYPVYTRLYGLVPDSLPLNIQYCRVLYETKQWETLVNVAEKVLARDETQSEVETMYAEALAKTGKIDQAIDAYRKKNIDSLTTKQLKDFAKVLKLANKNDSAILLYSKALGKDSSQCDIPYDLGSLLMKVKKYPEAIVMFQRKIDCDTASGYRFASYLNMAMSEMQLKDFETAIDHIKTSIKVRPEFVPGWYMLSQANANADKVDDAIAAYNKMIELAKEAEVNDPGKYAKQQEEAYSYMGTQYLLRKDYTKAIEALRKALPFNTKNCQTPLWIGQCYHQLKNLDEAKKWYCKVMNACPKSKEAESANTGLKLMGEDCK